MFHWLGRFHDPISAQMEPKINGKQKGPGSFPSPFHPMSFRSADHAREHRQTTSIDLMFGVRPSQRSAAPSAFR